MKTLKIQRPDFEVQAILGLFPDDPIDFGDSFFDTFNPRYTRVSIGEIESALSLGLKLNPYTVNDTEAWSRYVKIGVTGMITDFPQQGA